MAIGNFNETNLNRYPLYGDNRFILFSREHSNILHRTNHIKRHGEEIVRSMEGSVIYAFFPHCGHFDPLMVYGDLLDLGLHRTTIVAAAADHWFTKRHMIVGGNMMMPMVPMPRPGLGGARPKEVAAVLEYLGKKRVALGQSLVWAPEGTRSNRDIDKRELKSGIVHLARDSNRPVIPVVLRGLEYAWPKDQKPNPKYVVGNHIDVCYLPPMMWTDFGNERLFLDVLKQNYVQAYQELQQLR